MVAVDIDKLRAEYPESFTDDGEHIPPWVLHPEYGINGFVNSLGFHPTQVFDRWGAYCDTLPDDEEVRVAYLRRYLPAPLDWELFIQAFIDTSVIIDDLPLEWSKERQQHLVDIGLIANDAAFTCWVNRYPNWQPWSREESAPAKLVRYAARGLWFWSRSLEGRLRSELVPSSAADEWEPFLETFRREAAPPDIDPRRGLETMLHFMCAGDVVGPWELGLKKRKNPKFHNLANADYQTVYAWWLGCSFDDEPTLEAYFDAHDAPDHWRAWAAKQVCLG